MLPGGVGARLRRDLVTPSRHRRSPYVAAGLSFLWPGLGHWYAGRSRAAVLFATPLIGLALIGLIEVVGGLDQVAVLLITPSSALTILILVGLVGLWRLIAITDALLGFRNRAPFRDRRVLATFVPLALAVVLVHGYIGYVTWAFYDAGSRIFVGDPGPDRTPAPTVVPGQIAGPSDEYLATPFATPATKLSRINVLLTGVGWAAARGRARPPPG
jgi:hypothetical protein